MSIEIAHPRRGPGYGWNSELLDLDAYLDRIGYRGDRAPTAETLRALHLAHIAAIPFENLEVVFGRPVDLDLGSVQDKLVRRPRGGYCYEHVGLFAAVLERLGYTITGLLSRVVMDSDRLIPATHSLLLVEASGTRWICDVGLGCGPLGPIEFADGAQDTEGGWTNRLHEVSGTGEWEVQRWTGERWMVLHRFTTNPAYTIDHRVGNHYIATHPRSPFSGDLHAMRIGPGFLHTLDGTVLTTTRPDGAVDKRRLAASEVPGVLAKQFDVVLDTDDSAALVAYLEP
ncbi:arylamine N-acetyltransferase family protein [Saccharopolyspora taberi]|uniref:Arylamine N-acetyltransferase n=1 Tax=Saccharopolyspora taberi TaxID=60895 RepID=A0ABN3VN28_9PSEU